MPLWLDELVLGATDALYARRTWPLPPPERIQACRIVSHRGERDDRAVFENTFAAFDALRGTGVHGIEFDVRWTADLQPVVFHDEDLQRVFGDPLQLTECTLRELKARYPAIPALHDFVRRYFEDFHLMVELKEEPYPDPALQNQRLAEALAPALERKRCHVLSLMPAMFGLLPALPASRTVGVARLNDGAISAESLAAGRGGFASHYATLGEQRIRQHHGAGQFVGCGFPDSLPVLYREIGRGVDYVFTNRARQLERWRQQALAQATGTPVPRG